MTEKKERKEKLVLGRRIVTFIGPEGSGKTTQALRLSEESGMPYVTTGDTLRDLAENDPGELGDECRAMFEAGAYLSGETLLKILVNRFGKADVADGLILDGGLRTLEETVAFQSMLDEAGLRLPMTVIYLQIPIETSFERLVSGTNARKRKDDTEEKVTCRLSKFNLRLEERLEEIVRQPDWDLLPMDATSEAGEVYAQICQVLTHSGT